MWCIFRRARSAQRELDQLLSFGLDDPRKLGEILMRVAICATILVSGLALPAQTRPNPGRCRPDEISYRRARNFGHLLGRKDWRMACVAKNIDSCSLVAELALSDQFLKPSMSIKYRSNNGWRKERCYAP